MDAESNGHIDQKVKIPVPDGAGQPGLFEVASESYVVQCATEATAKQVCDMLASRPVSWIRVGVYPFEVRCVYLKCDRGDLPPELRDSYAHIISKIDGCARALSAEELTESF